MSLKKPVDHPMIATGKIGVLLVNLGTPDGYDKKNMRKYLAEFLSDKRVIEWPKIIWYPILYGIVLNTRPKKSGAAYRSIWNDKDNESPLRTITRSQAEKLAKSFKKHEGLIIDWAMRYGNPSIPLKLDELKKAGCERVLIFPLYPQYSASTTATVNDVVYKYQLDERWQFALRIVPPYFDDPAYIAALAGSIKTHFDRLDFKPEKLISSYHGIPNSYWQKGDPYHCHCHKTSRLLEEALDWKPGRLITTFQSRFGPEQWLEPYTDETIKKLAETGVKDIAVINPGFAADCLETLEEIAGEGKEIFLEHGGRNFSHIACLNDGKDGMTLFEKLVKRELSGWV